jgi:hypothetical protein
MLMPDLDERRTTPRLRYGRHTEARLYLNGQVCPVLDLASSGVRYELPAIPVRPSTSAVFEGEIRLACGELVPILGRVIRTHGPVAAARFDPTPISHLQLARELDFLRQASPLPQATERRRWRSRQPGQLPHEPRRSEA